MIKFTSSFKRTQFIRRKRPDMNINDDEASTSKHIRLGKENKVINYITYLISWFYF